MKNLKMLGIFIAGMVLSVSIVYAEGTQQPEYAKKESGLFVCTVDTNEKFVEAATITWKNANNKTKSCDEIRIASGATITVSSEVNIGDKILEIGYDEDDSVESLIVTTGGKLTVGQEGAVNASQNSVIEVRDGGVIDSQSSLNLYGSKGTSRVTIKGAGSTIYIHDTNGLESYAIDEFATVEVLNGGKVKVTKAQGGINATNVYITDAEVEITDNHVDGDPDEWNAGIEGTLVTSGNAKLVVTNNDRGLVLKKGSSIGGYTIADVTNNKVGIVLKGQEADSKATIKDNATVTTTDVQKNGKKVALHLVVDSTNAMFNYVSNGGEDFIELLNGTITDGNVDSPVDHVLYANQDVFLESSKTVKNTGMEDITVYARDSKNGVVLSANTTNTYEVISVTIGNDTFYLFKGETLKDLTDSANALLETAMSPASGKIYAGLYDGETEITLETPLNKNTVLTVKFEDIPVVPSTFDSIGLYALVGIIGLLGLASTMVFVKKEY